MLAEAPDIVIVATGGLPDTGFLDAGEELVATSWDVLAGDASPGRPGRPGRETLVFDDNGAYPAMQAAEMLAEAGDRVEIVTPERFFAPEIGGINHVAYARCFEIHDVRITLNRRLVSVRRDGNRLLATLGSDYTSDTVERSVDQVVVEHGTLPLDDLYFALKDGSINRGAVDYRALIAGRSQTIAPNPDGRYRLFRIGDAVASRNIHAAIYDALRLCKDF